MADATGRCQDTISCNSQTKITYRDVIILRKIEGLSIEETSNILGWNEGKVKTH